jgi:nucleotide-binding universal stress UspA family protein
VSSRPPAESLLDPELGRGFLDRVLCGVDVTPESLVAVRQADRLRAPGAGLDIVSALDFGVTAHAGWAASAAAGQLQAEAQRAVDAAGAEAPEADARIVEGRADQVLVAEAERLGATLIAVGTHEISRTLGIALGSVTTEMLHRAPCSVLVARAPESDEDFPRGIVVGVDGSPESRLAAALAFHLGERFGVRAWPVAARGGKGFDEAAVEQIATGVLVEDGSAVDTLVAAAATADLLLVGSRGLTGVRALGSVSERVAHRAPCSVLVVRPPVRP